GEVRGRWGEGGRGEKVVVYGLEDGDLTLPRPPVEQSRLVVGGPVPIGVAEDRPDGPDVVLKIPGPEHLALTGRPHRLRHRAQIGDDDRQSRLRVLEELLNERDFVVEPVVYRDDADVCCRQEI